MKKTRILVPLILFILISTIGFAADGFKANIYAIKQNVYPSEVGEFRVEITNTMNHSKTFTIYTQSMNPGWLYQQDYSLKIDSNETKSTKIYVTPDKNAEAGNRGFFVHIYPKDNLNNYLKLESFVTVVRSEQLSVSSLRTFKTTYNPGETVNVTGMIKNVAAHEVGSYSVEAVLANESNRVSIPLLDTSENFYFNIPLRVDEKLVGTQPIKFNILNPENKIESSKEIKINVPTIQSVTVDKKDHNYFFWHSYHIKVKNAGNVRKDSQTVTSTVNKLQTYLMSSNLKYDRKEKVPGGIKYNWVISNLEPGETVTVSYRINYWIIFLIVIFLFLVGFFGVYEFKLPTIMKIVRKSKGEHTVHLYIKNNTKDILTKVRVIDHLPEIVKVSNTFESAKPSLVTRKKDNIELEWKINKLNPGEERILSYKFRPLLKVEGTVTLPKAHLEFFFRNKDRVRKSKPAITYF